MTAYQGEGGAAAVAELQGLDGAFSFAERLLQRIWFEGDFDRARAQTMDGREVRITHPGRWNRMGGPDFFDARLEIAGEPVRGDVEVHLHASDWRAHGHSADAHYRNVVLHVVLFPPQGSVTLGVNDRPIPILSLLPLLYRGLEEYAADEAVERLAGQTHSWAEDALLSRTPEQLQAELSACAKARWEQKVAFAAARIRRLGWQEACHHAALEILGYRFNRGPMLRLATEYPLTEWSQALQKPGAVDALYDQQRERWARQAVRPVNHPRMRLRQYAAWCARVPAWPTVLDDWLRTTLREPPLDPFGPEGIAVIAGHSRALAKRVCGGRVGGLRQHTLVCDGFLPLGAAARTEIAPGCAAFWLAWFPGDLPATTLKLLRVAGITAPGGPRPTNGAAQGLLGWLTQQQENKGLSTAWPCGGGT